LFYFLFTFAFDTELIAGPLGSGQLMEPRGLQAFSEDTKDLIFFFLLDATRLSGLVVHVYMVCYDSMEIGKWLVRIVAEPSKQGRQDEMDGHR
jgi:hypothetical protein